MPRAKAILQADFPYHLTARCINREWFYIPMNNVWNIFEVELAHVVQAKQLQIHSFVLMSNHFHLIASTPQANISECMHLFMGRTSRALTKQGNRINETFAGRHYKCILQHPNYYLNAYKYIYRNPVSAGLCKSVEEYPFSTLQTVRGNRKTLFPMVEDTTYLNDPEGTLKWLNTAPDPERLDAVRFGLKRLYFTSKKSRLNNKPILDMNDIL